ncbi:pyridoxamine 5'-phosphate oxidase family protein [Aeromonas cavernicola]|uniref:Pyridoxamine 5'-phosphate oxidase n=1 Tax=Aeromonas cavernicola TaxID=1006623 RepID=A0A2H9U101_9GAMM|nr:pyridoxamine 5'-phosphate oxidase family protein [Aeromonas cavernicola]PJG57722.1 pyridoxamine 5'-phosphate oxidase [Aeromonas cavernicola]
MGQKYPELSEKHIEFISQQKLFFVGTATGDSRVNISPKGMDSFRIINSKRVVWLNVTGSGNETAAHIQSTPRMTIMFFALEGAPLILRLYGRATVIHPADPEWQTLQARFPPLPGARQIFDLEVELVQSSCGMAVPYFSYQGDRDLLSNWATQKRDEGIKAYWAEKNQFSIDGIPTHIIKQGG